MSVSSSAGVDVPVELRHKILSVDEPLDSRIRALYALKQHHRNEQGAAVLLEAIRTTHSVLFQHEIIYNIGQFGFSSSLPGLVAVLRDKQFDVVSRHEAIEAIGAICSSAPTVTVVLEDTMRDATESAPIRESCELALARIKLAAAHSGDRDALQNRRTHFVSRDPAPALDDADVLAGKPQPPGTYDTQLLKMVMCNPQESLFRRYQAMFALRNRGDSESVAALCSALRDDKTSCLFRHEVAFVLGQLEHSESVEALAEALRDEQEHEMVRHESAEALGAIADPRFWDTLKQYASHPSQLVADSCQVALEMHTYWSQFRPAV